MNYQEWEEGVREFDKDMHELKSEFIKGAVEKMKEASILLKQAPNLRSSQQIWTLMDYFLGKRWMPAYWKKEIIQEVELSFSHDRCKLQAIPRRGKEERSDERP